MENFGVHLGGANISPREGRDVIHNAYDQDGVIPVKYDADYSNIPVEMQNFLGICTSEAVLTLIEKFRGDGVRLSRRFQYVGQKLYFDGNLEEGSSIKAALHFAYKIGTQPESVIPTDTKMTYSDFVNFDPIPFYATATKIPGYTNVPCDSNSVASAIVKYKGVAARFQCGATWYTDIFGNITWDAAKILPLRQPNPVVTGHAVVLTGYDYSDDDETNVRNSWSEKWALGGNGYFIWTQYAPNEAWAILPSTPSIPSLPLKFTRQMGFGAVGAQVLLLQQTLVSGGFGSFSCTGFFGFKTEDAVKTYQRAHGIIDTGYVGILTLASLNKS